MAERIQMVGDRLRPTRLIDELDELVFGNENFEQLHSTYRAHLRMNRAPRAETRGVQSVSSV